jgi:rhodanese-related sulfurtransferase
MYCSFKRNNIEIRNFSDREKFVMSYAGDVSCSDCYSALSQDQSSSLVDVRTQAEWVFVGIPDLDGLGKMVHMVDWQVYPTMQVNSEFVSMVQDRLENENTGDEDVKNRKIFCICRSGVRSIAAAQALTASGFTQAYNVLSGFEGDPDHNGQRGKQSGWKFDELPWRQH